MRGGDRVKKTTAERLQELMRERDLRQSDILRLAEPFSIYYDIPLNRANVSMYVSGKVAPAQDKLFLLACALNVSESWLMGLDVPQERTPEARKIAASVVDLMQLETGNQILLADVLRNPQQKARLLSYAEKLRALGSPETEGK